MKENKKNHSKDVNENKNNSLKNSDDFVSFYLDSDASNQEISQETDIKDFVRNKAESRQKIKKSEREKKRKKKIKTKPIVRADDIDRIYYNAFDIFFIKIWATLCAFVTGTAKLVYKFLKYAFRFSPPLKYIKVLISFILVAVVYILCILPFLIPLINANEVIKEKDKQIQSLKESNEKLSKTLKDNGIPNPEDVTVEKNTNNTANAAINYAENLFNNFIFRTK